MKYIHYGSSEFNRDQFIDIFNRGHFNKPLGGLWASPINPKNIGWNEWCERNDFHLDKLSEYFIFSLSENAEILNIKSSKDVRYLEYLAGIKTPFSDYSFDFELLKKMGYDGIEVEMNNSDIYFDLYGWDVDSILIFNPDVIIIENSCQK